MSLEYETYRLKKEAVDFFLLKGVIKESIDMLRLATPEGYYIDFDIIVNDPQRIETVTRLYAKSIKNIPFERKPTLLCFIEKNSGGTVGAIRIAGYLSVLTDITNFTLRLSKMIEDEQVKIRPFLDEYDDSKGGKLRNSKITIITDHITSGKEVLNAIDVIEYNGGTVTDVIAYTVKKKRLDPRFIEKNIRIISIFDEPDELPIEIRTKILTPNMKI